MQTHRYSVETKKADTNQDRSGLDAKFEVEIMITWGIDSNGVWRETCEGAGALLMFPH